jgi:hypothetical protein
MLAQRSEHSDRVFVLKVNQMFDNLRNDLRYLDLLRRGNKVS